MTPEQIQRAEFIASTPPTAEQLRQALLNLKEQRANCYRCIDQRSKFLWKLSLAELRHMAATASLVVEGHCKGAYIQALTQHFEAKLEIKSLEQRIALYERCLAACQQEFA